jgi:serine protease AprX
MMCALLAPTVGAQAVGAATTSTPIVSLNSSLKIHPLLQYGAAADPTRLVRVIVQKSSTNILDGLIVGLLSGVQIDEDFKLIPAFVATVPQTAVALLALNPNVRYISPDGPVLVLPGLLPSGILPTQSPQQPQSEQETANPVSAANLLTTYPIDTGATSLWSGQAGHVYTGAGTTVALIDSGIDASHPDFAGHVMAVNVNKRATSAADGYGHGTHVAGIIGGRDPSGHYLGMAPNTTLVSVKVADDQGNAMESDLLRGLDWVEMYRGAYHIQALNLSVSVGIPESYATSPVDAAVERLWRDSVTVVAAAGNLGAAQDAVWYAPGNDPLVITVGCLDENGTSSLSDDSLCPISSRGVTEDGFAKPDLVAPGRRIVSALASGPNGQGVTLGAEFPDRITPDGRHIRLSGTSMAAPGVAGAVALLLERQPGLNPDQVKQLLRTTTHTYPGQTDSAGMLDVARAMLGAQNPPNTVQVPLPVSGTAPPQGAITLLWDGSRWGSTYWDGARWGSSYWDGTRWGAAEWDGTRWGSAYWDGTRWGNAYWDGTRWGGSAWDSASSFD